MGGNQADHSRPSQEQAFLYPRVVGAEWERLPAIVRQAHFTGRPVRLAGTLTVETGEGPVVRFLLWLLGLRLESGRHDVRLSVTGDAEREVWRRQFQHRVWRTEQRPANDGNPWIAERVGPFEVTLRVHAADDGLRYETVRCRFRVFAGGVGLPAVCCPRVTGFEGRGAAGALAVDVRAELPGLGLLIAYHGDLMPDEKSP